MHAGEATGQYKNYFNICRIATETDEGIDLESDVNEWQQVEEEDALAASKVNKLFNEKAAEVENWNKYKVFEEVTDEVATIYISEISGHRKDKRE